MGIAGVRQRDLLSNHGVECPCRRHGQRASSEGGHFFPSGAGAAELSNAAVPELLLAEREEGAGSHAEGAQPPTATE